MPKESKLFELGSRIWRKAEYFTSKYPEPIKRDCIGYWNGFFTNTAGSPIQSPSDLMYFTGMKESDLKPFCKIEDVLLVRFNNQSEKSLFTINFVSRFRNNSSYIKLFVKIDAALVPFPNASLFHRGLVPIRVS